MINSLRNINVLLNRMECIDELLCIVDPTKKQEFRYNNSYAYNNIKPFMTCPNITNESNNTQIEAYHESLTNLQKQFKKDCFDINTPDLKFHNNTLLHWAIFNSCVHSTLFLINNRQNFKLNINLQETANNLTPLHTSIIKGRNRCNNNNCTKYPKMDKVIDLLIECDDLDINIQDKKGNTSFDLAIILYDFPTVEKIRTKYPDIQISDKIIEKYKTIAFDFEGYSIEASYYENVKNDTNKKDYLTENYNKIKAFLKL